MTDVAHPDDTRELLLTLLRSDRRSGPWKCYFCGEVFPDGVTAGRHFGEPEGCECPVPGCVDPLRRDEKARLHAVQIANYEARKAQDERDALTDALLDIIAAIPANQGGTQGTIRKRAVDAIAKARNAT